MSEKNYHYRTRKILPKTETVSSINEKHKKSILKAQSKACVATRRVWKEKQKMDIHYKPERFLQIDRKMYHEQNQITVSKRIADLLAKHTVQFNRNQSAPRHPTNDWCRKQVCGPQKAIQMTKNCKVPCKDQIQYFWNTAQWPNETHSISA